MVKISRYILVLTGILVAAISIPKFFWTVFAKVPNAPSVFYSCVIDDFVTIDSRGKETIRYDTKGNKYTADEYEKLNPLMFFRQLVADGNMPDTIKGVYMEPSAIHKASSFYRYNPKSLRSPQPPLWPMFEAESGRVNLEMPPDYFRIKERMEFIIAETNRVDKEKSELFTAELTAKGFAFPATIIAGIPTTRKSHDEGYFVTDSNGTLFHIKLVKGKPVVNRIDTPAGLGIVYIECVDIRSQEFYCYLFTENNGVYVVMDEVYDLERLPVEGFDPYTHTLRVTCDLFNKTIIHIQDGLMKVVAIDDMYEIVNEYEIKWEGKYERKDGKLFATIFPFEIRLSIPESGFVNFYFNLSPGYKWLAINMVLLVATILILRWKGRKLTKNILDLILVALTGCFGMAAIFIFPNKFN